MVDKKVLQDLAPRFTIGVLARKTGCNIETIRYYEKAGMLPHPARSEGGHRLYGSGHVKRLSFVMKARALGFTLSETRALLGLAEREHPCEEARTVAAKHLEDVQAKIADLRTMEAVLGTWLSAVTPIAPQSVPSSKECSTKRRCSLIPAGHSLGA